MEKGVKFDTYWNPSLHMGMTSHVEFNGKSVMDIGTQVKLDVPLGFHHPSSPTISPAHYYEALEKGHVCDFSFWYQAHS